MRRWRMDVGHEDWWHKGTCLTSTSFHVCDMDINFLISVFRKLFIMILTSGATKIHTTLPEEGLGLIHKRPSCQPTGTQPSPRSAWVWRSATNYGSLLSTSTPLRCTLWSLTGDTAPPHWVVTSGRSWLVHKASLQTYCNKEGFNAKCSENPDFKARLGIISNEYDNCRSCDSRIGFGTGGRHGDRNTCGNEATYSPDNGNKHIKTMGYILVQ